MKGGTKIPTQVYSCPIHGEFDVFMSFSDEIPELKPCPIVDPKDNCGKRSVHVIKPPAGIVVQGGTGAGRGHTQARADSRFNETFSLDPRSKAELQHKNVTAEHKEVGKKPLGVDSDGMRKVAANIAADDKRRPRGRLAGA